MLVIFISITIIYYRVIFRDVMRNISKSLTNLVKYRLDYKFIIQYFMSSGLQFEVLKHFQLCQTPILK